MISNEEFKNTEAILFSYKKLDSQIRQIDLDIENIKLDSNSYKSIDYSKEKISKTYSVGSEVEDFIIEKENKIEVLENNKLKIINLKKKIEIAISNFTEEQKELFKMRYVENANWLRIITDMHISKDTYYKVRYQLVNSAAESLNPIRAVKNLEKLYKKGYYTSEDWEL